MSGFKDIVGHQEIIQHFQNAIQLGKVSHAYILSGETGAGKKLLASTFAKTLQCEQKGIDAWGECSSCKKTESRNHPDIIWVTHEKPNSIGIDELRAQLIDNVSIKPYCSSYKIYILPDAEKLTLQAQNALLKTIEEPPAYAIIMLLTNNIEAFLPTITSRCVKLNLRPLQESMVKEYLMEQMHLPDYQAELNASFSHGNIGKAKEISQSEEFTVMQERALRVLHKAREMEIYELIDAIKELSAEKYSIYEYLDLYIMWFRDVLLYKATRDMDGLIFKDQLNYVKERASKSSYEGIETMINAIEKAKERLRSNVNFDLTMELLFMTIREN